MTISNEKKELSYDDENIEMMTYDDDDDSNDADDELDADVDIGLLSLSEVSEAAGSEAKNCRPLKRKKVKMHFQDFSTHNTRRVLKASILRKELGKKNITLIACSPPLAFCRKVVGASFGFPPEQRKNTILLL